EMRSRLCLPSHCVPAARSASVLVPFPQPGIDPCGNLVTDRAEFVEAFLVRPLARRVVEQPDETVQCPRPSRRALAAGVVANDDEIPYRELAEVLVQMLRSVGAHIDADLAHHADREGMNSLGCGPGAVGVEPIPGRPAEQGLRHLTPGRIAGTQE